MQINRVGSWLLLVSQLLFLVSSAIEPPATPTTILIRVVLPLVVVGYVGLILGGVIAPRK